MLFVHTITSGIGCPKGAGPCRDRCDLRPLCDTIDSDRPDADPVQPSGGQELVIAHCSVGHGPYDPTQKAPDGLSDRPAGYYDLYVASFRLDGAEYEVQAQRLELEEVVKIVASIVEGQAKEGAAGAAG